ncbi:putative regulatory protein [Escherichia coli]|uniref:Putative regulatory protein n=4 Tax=Escherichia coli TaxID=562 RepID=A0A376VWE0_ECOLX|nr:putative regulatory protein [Escherichia coli]
MHARSAREINQCYRTLRPRLLMCMIIGYAAFYLTRKSVNYVLPALQTDLGLDKGDIGLLGSLFYLSYGLSKFTAGLWHDSHGQRGFMGIGLFATGLLNVVFAFGESLTLLLVVWTLNGFFQGWGWPPCARLLTHWYSRNERGFWWGCWNMSINIGGAIIPLISAFAAYWWGWQAAMLTPGIISMALGIWLTLQLKSTPQEEGLPTVGHWRHDPLELRQEQQSPPMGLWQMLRTTMLQNPLIWLLGVSYVLVYVIRIALNDWGNIWLTESHGVNLLSANATVMLFEVGGLLGALFAGWGSDLLFSGQRAPMIFAVYPWVDGFGRCTLVGTGSSLCPSGCVLFYCGLFCLWPANADWTCGSGMWTQSCGGFNHRISRPVRLSRCGAGRLAVVAGYRTLRLVGNVQFTLGRRSTYGFTADAVTDGGHHHHSRSKDKTMKMPLTSTLIASAVALATLTGAAQAKGRLVVYCSATNEMCETETKEFGEKYDVKTSFIRNGSGSTLAKVDAEKKNPQADVWYGGTLDPQSQAGEMGLLQAYKSPNLEQIMENSAIRQK